MPEAFDHEIRSFERRVDLYVFLGGLAEGAVVGAVGLLAVGLVLRLLRIPFVPPLYLLGAVGAAALVGGVWRLRALRFSRDDSAAHLDRRLGLDGLLLSAQEVDTGAWQGRIDAGLEEAKAARPHLAAGPLLGRFGLAAAAAAVAFLLPPALAPAHHADRLAEETLAEFEAKLEKLEEEDGLDEEAAEELRERFEGLKASQEEMGTLAWEDFDALDARLEHEQDLKTGRLAKAAAAASALAADSGQGDPAEIAEQFQDLLEMAEQAGLVDQLPQGLQDQLGLGEGQPGMAGADAMALDPELMKQLASALAGLAGQELAGLADAGMLEGLTAEELQRLLEEILAAANACELCDGTDKDCPG